MATRSDKEETETSDEPNPNSLGADVFGDTGDSEDPLGLKNLKPEEGRKAKKGSEVRVKKEPSKEPSKESSRGPSKKPVSRKRSDDDPFAALSDDAALSDEGRSLARAIKTIQSRADSQTSRLEGLLREVATRFSSNGEREKAAEKASPDEELVHPLEAAEARFLAQGKELPEAYRGAARLVEDLFDYHIKRLGLDKVSGSLDELRTGYGNLQQTLGNQTSSGVRQEAQELLAAYDREDIAAKWNILKSYRGLPHPGTGQPMSLVQAMDLITGNTAEEAEELEDEEEDLILSAKQRARGRSTGGRAERSTKGSGEDLDQVLNSLFG